VGTSLRYLARWERVRATNLTPTNAEITRRDDDQLGIDARDHTLSVHRGKTKGLLIVIVDDGVELSREQRDVSDMPMCTEDHGEKPNCVSERLVDCDVDIAGGKRTSIGRPDRRDEH
jgi:hypothetical protein